MKVMAKLKLNHSPCQLVLLIAKLLDLLLEKDYTRVVEMKNSLIRFQHPKGQ